VKESASGGLKSVEDGEEEAIVVVNHSGIAAK
jgi:hypothetical protein